MQFWKILQIQQTLSQKIGQEKVKHYLWA